MTEALNWIRDTFDHADAATVLGAALGAAIAALVAVLAYVGQQWQQRRQAESATVRRSFAVSGGLFGGAIQGEAARRVARRPCACDRPCQRRAIAHLVLRRIADHQREASTVADAFEAFVAAARREAGPAMTRAWQAKPTKKDRDVRT